MSPSSIKSNHRATPSRAHPPEKNKIKLDKRTRILEVLDGKKMSWTELKEATGYPDGTLSDTLNSLIDDDLIVHPGKFSKYVRMKDIELMEEETKGIAQCLRKQRIIKLVNRMRAAEEKAEDATRARNELKEMIFGAEEATEVVKKQKIIKELTAIDQTGKQLYSPVDAEKMYEIYHRKSEQRMWQEIEDLVDKLENEEGDELKKKVATVLSRKDESGAYSLHLIYKDHGIQH